MGTALVPLWVKAVLKALPAHPLCLCGVITIMVSFFSIREAPFPSGKGYVWRTLVTLVFVFV